ncbi:hypothetical protein UNPA324_10540 [Bradyrhizobium sp. UNPA324]|nr:hypothetical protein UNPA324_10540 [Bradyrhizobium sp. UNPA324]
MGVLRIKVTSSAHVLIKTSARWSLMSPLEEKMSLRAIPSRRSSMQLPDLQLARINFATYFVMFWSS